MKLSDLTQAVKAIQVQDAVQSDPTAGRPDPEIGSIHYRAQDVQPGGMFVAIAGSNADGHDYIDEALSRGAGAIVTQKQTRIDGLSIAVSDTRRALAMLAAAFYGNPSEQLVLIAITGLVIMGVR